MDRFGDFARSECSSADCCLSTLGSAGLRPAAMCCKCPRMLSEYARVETQDRTSRGTEKDRKVVKPTASPRVDANVEAILKERVGVWTVYVQRSNLKIVGVTWFATFGLQVHQWNSRAKPPKLEAVCLAPRLPQASS